MDGEEEEEDEVSDDHEEKVEEVGEREVTCAHLD